MRVILKLNVIVAVLLFGATGLVHAQHPAVLEAQRALHIAELRFADARASLDAAYSNVANARARRDQVASDHRALSEAVACAEADFAAAEQRLNQSVARYDATMARLESIERDLGAVQMDLDESLSRLDAMRAQVRATVEASDEYRRLSAELLDAEAQRDAIVREVIEKLGPDATEQQVREAIEKHPRFGVILHVQELQRARTDLIEQSYARLAVEDRYVEQMSRYGEAQRAGLELQSLAAAVERERAIQLDAVRSSQAACASQSGRLNALRADLSQLRHALDDANARTYAAERDYANAVAWYEQATCDRDAAAQRLNWVVAQYPGYDRGGVVVRVPVYRDDGRDRDGQYRRDREREDVERRREEDFRRERERRAREEDERNARSERETRERRDDEQRRREQQDRDRRESEQRRQSDTAQHPRRDQDRTPISDPRLRDQNRDQRGDDEISQQNAEARRRIEEMRRNSDQKRQQEDAKRQQEERQRQADEQRRRDEQRQRDADRQRQADEQRRRDEQRQRDADRQHQADEQRRRDEQRQRDADRQRQADEQRRRDDSARRDDSRSSRPPENAGPQRPGSPSEPQRRSR